ncbi:MAG: Gfo/Idh/MocA family oxidoreductase [Candidatus Pacearchaeota archaeon]|jgi:predicted dehydrogenase
MNDRMEFGIVGAGISASMIARDTRTSKFVKLGAICDVEEDVVRNFAVTNGLDSSRCYTDLSKMLTRDDLDFVVVSVPPYLHKPTGIQIAKARKHVVVEKPITTTLEDADELIRVCEGEGVELFAVSQKRYEGDVLRAKSLMPKLGNVFYAEMRSRWFRPQSYFEGKDGRINWKGKWKLAGGGALLNQGIHGLDVLFYLCGELERVRARGKIANHRNIEVEDLISANGIIHNGPDVEIYASTCDLGRDHTEIHILGRNGKIVLDDYCFVPGSGIYSPTGNLVEPFISSKTASVEGVDEGRVGNPLSHGGHEVQLEYIARELGGTPVSGISMVRGKDARDTLMSALAIYQSIEEKGRELWLPLQDHRYAPNPEVMSERLSFR